MGTIVFVTGTDTGAGKTLLTILLLIHLRRLGVATCAIKPFCSGAATDVELIGKVQGMELPRGLINPFFFEEPVAPLVAARKARRRIQLDEVLERIRAVQARCDLLLIEGAGGLFVPLGEDYMVADIIDALRCRVLVAARNKLGVINHVLLTVNALNQLTTEGTKVVLMDFARVSLAAVTNQSVLQEIIQPIEVQRLLYVGKERSVEGLKKIEKNFEKTLAQIARMDTFHTLLESSGKKDRQKKLLTVWGKKLS